jgi:hypothetical protein
MRTPTEPKTPTYKNLLQLNNHRSHSIANNFTVHILRNVNYPNCKKWASKIREAKVAQEHQKVSSLTYRDREGEAEFLPHQNSEHEVWTTSWEFCDRI